MSPPAKLNQTTPLKLVEYPALDEAIRLLRQWEDRLACSIEDSGWIAVGNVGPVLILGALRGNEQSPPLPEYAFQTVFVNGEDFDRVRLIGREIRTSGTADFHQPETAVGEFPLKLDARGAIRFLLDRFFLPLAVAEEITRISDPVRQAKTLPDDIRVVLNWLRRKGSEMLIDPRICEIPSHPAFPPEICDAYAITPVAVTATQVWYAGASETMEMRDRIVSRTDDLDLRFMLASAEAVKEARRDTGNEETALSRSALSTKKRNAQEDGDSEEIVLDWESADAAKIDPRSVRIGAREILIYLLDQAMAVDASDIHIMFSRGLGQIRFRVDGTLQDILHPSLQVTKALVAVVKEISTGMDTNNYNAQDGAFAFRRDDDVVNVRVSGIPHLQVGQKIVMRLLPKRNKRVANLDGLRMPDLYLQTFRRAISRPQGIILVTGPTGSGKTTTLYNCLSELNAPDVSIQTIEDPCEIILEGVNQTQVDKARNLTMNLAMKAVVRQDPDIILVGEIRDGETAELAVSAALTGHLVFSTLHSIDPVAAVDRLLKLGRTAGVTPSMIAQSLLLIQAQRLVKTLCPRCKTKRPVKASDLAIFDRHSESAPEMVYEAKGCPACSGEGYTGRRAIMEIMPATEPIVREISGEARPWVIREHMQAFGFVPMLNDGLRLVREGVTSIDQVVQYENAWDILENDDADQVYPPHKNSA